MKPSQQAIDQRLYNLRGCRVSEPIRPPFGGGCRIVEWVDDEGRIARRVVAEHVTEAEVAATIRQPLAGRRYLMHDDEQMPRETLPRR
ncbi:MULTISPECIES: DUF2866 domain-containing protein [Burkholderia]|uniref:DUF2866 domain-containing protein n=2 Tax=Burkholderia gladioli TaxID=28095 RepID=A0A095VYY4_BURGA|nr:MULTISPECIES: DUF2866 domain-containing protein [Burkholderia]AEA61205.1 hypothetical protein bgla_1g25850 [Burkholderia gladioli BSR3]AJW97415.1 hypothetical protein BM43_3872 [Burkholderia gladioli]ATF83818.1 DUF2866 domain-containing protein [Burkholderia gladioli pv. gladioli]AWY55003.1 hypothetical protein A8H28_28620 [Burkholderia gladioli pv. gladioli]AYQ88817.1 DUF2866 domain-containing protein [Burkholderia gladioli]